MNLVDLKSTNPYSTSHPSERSVLRNLSSALHYIYKNCTSIHYKWYIWAGLWQSLPQNFFHLIVSSLTKLTLLSIMLQTSSEKFKYWTFLWCTGSVTACSCQHQQGGMVSESMSVSSAASGWSAMCMSGKEYHPVFCLKSQNGHFPFSINSNLFVLHMYYLLL